MTLKETCEKCKEPYEGCFEKCPIGLMITDMERARKLEILKERKESREKAKEQDLEKVRIAQGI